MLKAHRGRWKSNKHSKRLYLGSIVYVTKNDEAILIELFVELLHRSLWLSGQVLSGAAHAEAAFRESVLRSDFATFRKRTGTRAGTRKRERPQVVLDSRNSKSVKRAMSWPIAI